jgi:hypothetical protein
VNTPVQPAPTSGDKIFLKGVFPRHRVSVLPNEKNSSDGGNATYVMYLMPPICMLKNW